MLSDSGVTQEEQAAHPQAVADIVAFYQDATKGMGAPAGAEQDDVWKKFGKNPNSGPIQFEQPVSLFLYDDRSFDISCCHLLHCFL